MRERQIISVRGTTPIIGERCFIAPGAYIIGEVVCGTDCSFWFHTVVRGDVNSIQIGDKVNIQDGAIIHATYERAGTYIGNQVSIGHGAMIHGCRIHDNVLVGMKAIIMDHSVIGEGSIIAAGAVVLERTIVEPGTIYAGVPAKKVKNVDSQLFQQQIQRICNNYPMYASWYKEIENG